MCVYVCVCVCMCVCVYVVFVVYVCVCCRYLVDIRWWQQWKKYVGYNAWDQSSIGQTSANPGPLDNSVLFRGRCAFEGLGICLLSRAGDLSVLKSWGLVCFELLVTCLL